MKLLDVIAAGIRGAENGSVDILVRGTSTRAQVFTDYDGSGAQTPTAALTLDANGGAIWYVNQAVTCRAYSSTGAVVRQFTAFEAATDVEVRSQSFTGVDYTTGASAAGNPTLLSTVLDLWKTSAGAIDFNVLVGATSRTLAAAMTAASGLFFNVKDPAYGATGLGVADDRAAIQAAITAANAVGGTVYFPPGTYLIGSGLTVNGAAGFMGPRGALLTATASGIAMITVTAGSNGKFSIIGMSFSGSGTTSTWLAQNTGDLSLYDVVGNFTFAAPQSAIGNIVLMGAGADALTAVNCVFACPLSVGSAAPISAKTVCLLYCEFNLAMNPTGFGGLNMTDGIVGGCDFTATGGLTGAASAGGCYINQDTQSPTQALLVFGSDFANPGGGTITTAIGHRFAGGANSTQGLYAFGNSYGTAITLPIFEGTYSDIDRQGDCDLSLETLEHFETNDTGLVTISARFGANRIRRTTNGAQTVNFAAPLFANQELTATYINDGVGVTGAIVVNGLKSPPTWTGLAAGSRSTIRAKGILIAGTVVWVAQPAVVWS